MPFDVMMEYAQVHDSAVCRTGLSSNLAMDEVGTEVKLGSVLLPMGNNMIQADQLAGADTEAAREAARLAHQAVNRVQMLMDVAWDVFICGAGGLVGLAMLRHPRFGWIWGGTGIAASVALLYLNLDTFPRGPAYAGSVDLGPLLALWFTAVYAWTLALTFRDRRPLH